MRKSDLYRINLNLLVVFKSLLKTQGVGRTAAELHMSQPAVSRALAGLRDIFGDPLFLKTAKGMLPTSKATGMANDIEQAIRYIEYIFEPKEFDPTASTRSFRIATTDYGAMIVMPPVMRHLTVAKSTVRLETPPLSTDLVEKLANGSLDFALYVESMRPKDVNALPLFEENYSCLVRKGHPVLERLDKGRVLIDDFVKWPHIITSVDTGQRGKMDERLERIGYKREVAVQTPYFQVAPLLVPESEAILTLPTRIAKFYSKLTDTALMKPPIEIVPFTYELIWHQMTTLDPGAIWMRELIVKSVRH